MAELDDEEIQQQERLKGIIGSLDSQLVRTLLYIIKYRNN
jgi:hypothetical protein